MRNAIWIAIGLVGGIALSMMAGLLYLHWAVNAVVGTH